jgi:hypothetical protein
MTDYTFDVNLSPGLGNPDDNGEIVYGNGGIAITLDEHPDVGFMLMIPNKGNEQVFSWLVHNMSSVAKDAIQRILESIPDE